MYFILTLVECPVIVDSLRSGALTPLAVRTQLTLFAVFHLTSVDWLSINELVFQIQPRWTTDPLIEHVTTSPVGVHFSFGVHWRYKYCTSSIPQANYTKFILRHFVPHWGTLRHTFILRHIEAHFYLRHIAKYIRTQTVHRVTQQSQSRNRPVFPATVVVIVVRRLTRFSSKDSLLRNGALTPSKVRLQLSRVTVFHFDPGRLDEPQLTQRYFVFQSNHGCTDYKRNKSAYEFIRK